MSGVLTGILIEKMIYWNSWTSHYISCWLRAYERVEWVRKHSLVMMHNLCCIRIRVSHDHCRIRTGKSELTQNYNQTNSAFQVESPEPRASWVFGHVPWALEPKEWTVRAPGTPERWAGRVIEDHGFGIIFQSGALYIKISFNLFKYDISNIVQKHMFLFKRFNALTELVPIGRPDCKSN